jgi:hypothetical protein
VAAKKKAAKVKAKTKTKTKAKKPEIKPFEFKKLERLTYKQFQTLDPCWEAIEWWKLTLGSRGTLELKPEAIGPSLFPSRQAVISFDFLWPQWLLRQLVERLIDQMPLNFTQYSRECQRLYRVCKVFNREASKAADQSSLTYATIEQRTTNAIVLCKALATTYQTM